MDNTLRALLTMVKSALTGSAERLEGTADLTAVAAMAARHQVGGLVYDGALRCGIDRQEPSMRSLFQTYCKSLLKSELQTEKLTELYQAFDEAEIDYLPLKGCIMKQMYPRPELRTMNDADILIRVEQYEKIKLVLETLGYRFLAESDCELKWTTKGLYLELHKRLIPSFIKDFYAYFGEGWHLAHCKDGSCYGLSPEDEFLFIFTHFARHYREGGVGIRHMADIWYYRYKTPQLDEARIMHVLKKMSLDTFYSNILLTLSNWFGSGEETELTKKITEYVANSGSFGTEESKELAGILRQSKGEGKKELVRQMLFPSLKNMRYAYPVLQKAPVLLPVMWVYRGVKVSLFHRDRIKAKERQLQNAGMQAIQEFEQNLRAVGLGMEFEEE